MATLFDRIDALLSRTPPFDALPDGERTALLQKMTLELYSPGEVILQQGEDVHRALYVVESGLVRLADAESGKTVEMVGEGSHFGSYGLVQGGALPYEARAVEPTSCALIAAETFQSLLDRNEAFKGFFDEDIKRYVRALDEDVDQSGAFLLFDTTIEKVLRAEPPTVPTGATVREVAQRMKASDLDAVVVVQDGLPVGVVTEGDLVEKVVAGDGDVTGPVMALVDRPPISLRTDERIFDAMRTMMRYRIRRIVVVDAADGRLRGLLTSEDLSHFRGLDPVATTERLERAHSIEELAALRADSNRRLHRLYHQGIQSEDLLDIVASVDDQLKERVLAIVEREVREEVAGDAPPEGTWAWLTFGAAGRRESVLRAWQDNGIVYADPEPGREEAAAAFYEALGTRAVAALQTCGYADPENGISAAEASFRQPLAAWTEAFDTWAAAEDAEATARAGLCFDLRALHGETDLARSLRETIAGHLPNGRLSAILAREGTRTAVPLSTFGRFEVDDDDGVTGLDLRGRVLIPVVRMARAMALEIGYLASASTFDRLRQVADSEHPLADQAKALLPAFTTLIDFHLRGQTQAAEIGADPSDRLDPGLLHRSQQNLLKETFKTVQRAQEAVRKHYGLG